MGSHYTGYRSVLTIPMSPQVTFAPGVHLHPGCIYTQNTLAPKVHFHPEYTYIQGTLTPRIHLYSEYIYTQCAFTFSVHLHWVHVHWVYIYTQCTLTLKVPVLSTGCTLSVSNWGYPQCTESALLCCPNGEGCFFNAHVGVLAIV